VEEAVVEATLTAGAGDLTPLMAFNKLEKLSLARWHFFPDSSPLIHLPLKDLTCPPITALRNAAVLAESTTLKTINGEPAAEYLAGLQSPPR
jgi:hypothetical protein